MRYSIGMKTLRTFFINSFGFLVSGLLLVGILMSTGCSSAAPAAVSAATTGEDVKTEKADKSGISTPEPVADPTSVRKRSDGSDAELYVTESAPAGEKGAPPSAMKSSASAGRPVNTESGLKAGVADDNNQYNYFLDFLNRYKSAPAIRPIPVENRIMLSVIDETGQPVPNAQVSIYNDKNLLVETLSTYADGKVLLTPPLDAIGPWSAEAVAPLSEPGKKPISGRIPFDPKGLRSLALTIPARPPQGGRWVPSSVPLDIVFILDTTGSMGEEIERLKATIEIIKDNLDLANPRPRIRFGLVLYRDRGDEYITRKYPLTEDLKKFQSYLAGAYADGGGDTPEDLEAALAAALDTRMNWNSKGSRLAFIITDAPAHAYMEGIPYSESAEQARVRGIKIHSIGTGGLDISGEYQLRQVAQRSRGKYIFLTYGEKGESEGGTAGAVSHHTGANWTADRLEAIIIRLAKEEISLLSGEKVTLPSDDYYEAKAVPERDKDSILDELFSETVNRLIDYSAASVTMASRVSLVPFAAQEKNAERFGARLLQAAIQSNRFTLLERNDLQAILQELELSLSAIADIESAAKIGKLLGAEYLILPALVSLPASQDDDIAWEVYLRLVRVDTGEILSVSRAKISRSLGL